MVNYEFNQLDRFIENSIFFDHPLENIIISKFYVLIALTTTKIILQVAQKTGVKKVLFRTSFMMQEENKLCAICFSILEMILY